MGKKLEHIHDMIYFCSKYSKKFEVVKDLLTNYLLLSICDCKVLYYFAEGKSLFREMEWKHIICS